MTTMLELAPFGPRDDARLFAELSALTQYHAGACVPYGHLVHAWPSPTHIADLPYVHVGLFKELDLRSTGVVHSRTLLSSATTSGVSSRIALDAESSRRQSISATAILRDFVGGGARALLVLDDAKSMRSRAGIPARIAAALSIKELAGDMHFVLSDGESGSQIAWDTVRKVLAEPGDIIVYGFTWVLWTAWAQGHMPTDVADTLRSRKVSFVHSGGWKKLESIRVDRGAFDHALLDGCGAGSTVVDYYGLVEQVGVIYPLCEHGARHVPVWADVIVRDSFTLEPLADAPGQLQLLNPLPVGGPYHSVLTEDLGRLLPDNCACGRLGRRFELIGRVPKAELRGCANV
jgi:hypothetical protein